MQAEEVSEAADEAAPARTAAEDVPAEAAPAVAQADAAAEGTPAEAAAGNLPDDLIAVAKGLDEPAEAETAVESETEPGSEGAEGAVTEAGGEETSGESADVGAQSLDDITPETVIVADTEEEEVSAQLAVDSGSVANWPFVAYVALWLIAAGVGVWEFLQVPAGQAIFDNSLYVTSVMAGIGLLVLGPVILLVVWLVTIFTREDARGGALFISALVKGASATLLGAIIWMGALVLIDYLRLGRLL